MQNIVLDTIKNRRSTRAYLPDALSGEVLEAILQAGQHAPSGANSQSCHFIVIQSPAVLGRLKEITQTAFAGMNVHEGMYSSLRASITAAQKGGYDFTYNAPVLVVIANKKGYGNAMADSACALENMAIAAAALEIGSCYINQLHWLDDHAAIREYMTGIGLQEDETICCALALGKPAQMPQRPLARTGNRISYIN